MAGNRKDTTQVIIGGVLKFVAAGGFLTTAIAAPNAVQIFDKPLNKFLNKLDKRAQERELRRVIHYMKQRGLIKYEAKDYEHGIRLTKEGKKRLNSQNNEAIAIPKPPRWDKKWRLVFFDIPEGQRAQRNSLTYRLRNLGLQQLQKSIWIHPFPCRPQIEAVSELTCVRRFVTYVEINEIDGENHLRDRFNHLLS